MRHLVFGAGAVGSLIGAQLLQAGYPVTFMARSETAARLRDRGLIVLKGDHEARLTSLDVITGLDELVPQTQPDAIWLAVKAYDCAEAAAMIARAFPRPPAVVCLLNGIGNEATLAARLGRDCVVAAAFTTAVQRLEPGLIRVERERGLGLAAGHPLAPELAKEAAQAALSPRLYKNGDCLKWSKLLTNLVANATSAVLGWTPRQVFAHPGICRLEIEALREAVRTLRAQGLHVVNLPRVPTALFSRAIFAPPALTARIVRRAVVSGRGDKLPSLNYDIGRGRSEVAWLNGAVARTASEHGLATPANAVLTRILTGLVESAIDPAEFRGKPQALLREAATAGVPNLQMYNAET